MAKAKRIVIPLKGFDYSKLKNDWFIEALLRAWINTIRFKNAVRVARAKKQATGKDYYVVEGDNVLWVFNSYERKLLNNIRVFGGDKGHYEVIQMAGYYTGWELGKNDSQAKKVRKKTSLQKVKTLKQQIRSKSLGLWRTKR